MTKVTSLKEIQNGDNIINVIIIIIIITTTTVQEVVVQMRTQLIKILHCHQQKQYIIGRTRGEKVGENHEKDKEVKDMISASFKSTGKQFPSVIHLGSLYCDRCVCATDLSLPVGTKCF